MVFHSVPDKQAGKNKHDRIQWSRRRLEVTDFHKRQAEPGDLEFSNNPLTRLIHKLVDRKCRTANSTHKTIRD